MPACQPTDSITCQRVNPSVRSNAMSRTNSPPPAADEHVGEHGGGHERHERAKERRNVIDLTEVEELALGVDEPGPEQLLAASRTPARVRLAALDHPHPGHVG